VGPFGRLARQVEEIDIKSNDDDLPALGLMSLAEKSAAFDWLADEDDLYSVADLKVRYK